MDESLKRLDAKLHEVSKGAERLTSDVPKEIRRAAHEERLGILKAIQRAHPQHRADEVEGGIRQLERKLDSGQY